jgi:hypothetical protein
MGMHPREVISGMRRWWQNWRGANSSLSELICCGKDEAERMAHDLGLPVSELRRLAEHGPEAADLLARRMAELNLDKNEVAAVVPSGSNLTLGFVWGFPHRLACASLWDA